MVTKAFHQVRSFSLRGLRWFLPPTFSHWLCLSLQMKKNKCNKLQNIPSLPSPSRKVSLSLGFGGVQIFRQTFACKPKSTHILHSFACVRRKRDGLRDLTHTPRWTTFQWHVLLADEKTKQKLWWLTRFSRSAPFSTATGFTSSGKISWTPVASLPVYGVFPARKGVVCDPQSGGLLFFGYFGVETRWSFTVTPVSDWAAGMGRHCETHPTGRVDAVGCPTVRHSHRSVPSCLLTLHQTVRLL